MNIERLRAIYRLSSTLRQARVRTLSFSDLLTRIPTLLDEPDRCDIIRRLEEIELDDTEATDLAAAIVDFDGVCQRLPSTARSRADSIIGRLIRTLPAKLAVDFALRDIHHRRKKRREYAVRTLRLTDLEACRLPPLMSAYEMTGNQGFLELVARNPDLVCASDEAFLLSQLVEPYWRMRVIECLIACREVEIELAEGYPHEFIWAVGRLRSVGYLQLADELVTEFAGDPQVVSIYIWAVGVIGDRSRLNAVAALVPLLEQELVEFEG